MASDHTSTTAEPADPFAVPAHIDETYVRRVLTELYRIQGDAFREAVSRGEVTQRALQLLQSVYVDSEVAFLVNGLSEIVGSPSPSVSTPGDVRVVAADVVAHTPGCLIVSSTLDYSAVIDGAVTERNLRIDLHREEASNRTGWRVHRTELLEARNHNRNVATCV